MKRRLKSVLYMFVLTLFFTSLVSAVKRTNDERIERNQEVKLQGIILKVLGIPLKIPTTDEEIDSTFKSRVKSVQAKNRTVYIGYEADGQRIKGFAFHVGGPGFWGPVQGLVAVDGAASKIIGVAFYRHSETPGLGGRISESWFTDQFKGLPLVLPEKGEGKFFSLKPEGTGRQANELDAITGATGTSRAVESFLNKELNLFLKDTWAALKGMER